jgi:hypothetical protein
MVINMKKMKFLRALHIIVMSIVILVFLCLAFYLYESSNFVVIATGIANKIVSFKGWVFTEAQVTSFIDEYSFLIIIGTIALLILEEIPYNRVYKKQIQKYNGGHKRMKKNKETNIVVIETEQKPSKKELRELAKKVKKEAKEAAAKAKVAKKALDAAHKVVEEAKADGTLPAEPVKNEAQSNNNKLKDILNSLK